MTLVYAKHEPWPHKIDGIVEQMMVLGPPTLRAVCYHGEFFALEGSHRLFAAHHLFLVPTLIIEPLDAPDTELRDFWQRVKHRLPVYDFLGLMARWPFEGTARDWYGSRAS